MSTIAIVTVIYQNYTVLEEFVRSLSKQTDKNFHLYLADLSENKKNLHLPEVSYTVIDADNEGYAHGVNMGVRRAIKDGNTNFCVINDDTYFGPGFVADLRAAFHDYAGSVFGGKIYYAPGYEFHNERYEEKDKGNIIWYAGGDINWKHVDGVHHGVDEVDIHQYDQSKETGFVTGCFICYDKSVHDLLGEWDEKYFLYFEDADFCERAKRKGIQLYYEPKLIIWHKNGQSTGGSGSKLHQKYQRTNRLIFGLKYAPLRTKLHLVKNTLF